MTTKVFYIDRQNDAENVATYLEGRSFRYTKSSFEEAFKAGDSIVAMVAAGIIVRALAPLINDKWTDPPVVLLSPDMQYAVPLLGGHHGANELAKSLQAMNIHPVLTTATEAKGIQAVEVIAKKGSLDIIDRDSTRAVNAAMLKEDIPICTISGPAIAIVGPGVSVLCRQGEYIVGLGCNRGVSPEEVTNAIGHALSDSSIEQEDVFVYATTRKKMDERGLTTAVGSLGANLVFVEDNVLDEQNCRAIKSNAHRA